MRVKIQKRSRRSTSTLARRFTFPDSKQILHTLAKLKVIIAIEGHRQIPNHEPDKISPHYSYVFKIHFNITLPSTPTSYEESLSFYFSHQNLLCTALPLHVTKVNQSHFRLRFPDYMTTAQDGGKVVSPTHRPSLPPGNAPGTHFC